MCATCLVALACNGHSPSRLTLTSAGNRASTEPGTQPPAELAAQLRQALNAEFARLGVDPAKVVAAAPQGTDNAVFDLAAEVIDPDGPPDGEGGGELPPTGIELRWTERLIGDYDQNGEVNYSDITPLGLHFNSLVDYDDPLLHGGFEAWPAGDPSDTGGASPPVPSSGAANWRMARIDGEANGELNFGDVTPLAVHWMEHIGGYNIYRRDPGSEAYVLLASIARPAANPSLPVRLSYPEQPPVGGEYRYYVTPYGADPQDEADEHSNIAVLMLEYGFADTLPPVWDDSVGAYEAMANPDGTVSVSWDSATDVAPVGVLAHPPVHFTVYWSTQTPVDHANAAFEEEVASPWTSPPLLDGQQYYFSVWASDSMEPLNQEHNTVEAPVISGGGPSVDLDPPVWTDMRSKWQGYEGEHPVEGIIDAQVHDGYLTVRRARAMDILSPPVQYNFYYGSGRSSEPLFTVLGLRAEHSVMDDVPEKFDVVWENRHLLLGIVRCKDSAPEANETPLTADTFQIRLAPSDLRRVEVNTDFPGREGDFSVTEGTAFDAFSRTMYSVYTTNTSLGGDREEMHCLVWDCDDGTWEHEFIGLAPEGASTEVSGRGFSPSGELWIQFDHNFGPFEFSQTTWHRTLSGEWMQFDTEIPRGWSGQFDHNGYPTWPSYQDSAAYPGERYQVLYNYFDPEAQEYKQEVVADPGGNFETHVRPNGTVTLVMNRDEKPSGAPEDPPRERVRVFERDLAGNWTIKFEQPDIYAFFSSGSFQDYWQEDWNWVLGVYGNLDPGYVLAAGSGFDLEGPRPPAYYSDGVEIDLTGEPFFPSRFGNYDVPYRFIWDGSEFRIYEYNGFNQSAILSPPITSTYALPTKYNRADGFLFSLQLHPSTDGSEYQLYAYTMESGNSIYELSP